MAKSVFCDTNRLFHAMGLQATVIRDIILSATSYGAVYDELCAFAGFSQEELSDSKLMVEWEKAAKIWDLLGDISGNEQIGLLIGAEMNISMNGMVGFLMQSCRTLAQAVEAYCQYGYMVCPMVKFVCIPQGDKTVLEMHQNAIWVATYPRNARMAMDFTFACIMGSIRQLTGKPIYPISVELAFDKIAVQDYKNLFNSEVSFNAPFYKMTFWTKYLDTPVITSDKSLFDMFNNILAQQKTMILQASTSDALRQMLVMHFKGLIPTIEDAAASMNMTVRTLQRKLSEEQTSFRIITSEVKKEMALHLMQRANANITEVAEIMGYSDLPAFRKAFKGWTKETPKAMRSQMRLEPALNL